MRGFGQARPPPLQSYTARCAVVPRMRSRRSRSKPFIRLQAVTRLNTLMAMPPTAPQIRQAAADALKPIERALEKLPPGNPLAALAEDLRYIGKVDDSKAEQMDELLTRFLPKELIQLNLALDAKPVNLASIPLPEAAKTVEAKIQFSANTRY